MLGWWLVLVFALGAALVLMIFVYYDEKELSRGRIERLSFELQEQTASNFSLAGLVNQRTREYQALQTSFLDLTTFVDEQVRKYSSLEEGMDEMEESYQQMVLEHQEKIQELLDELRKKNTD